MPAIAATPPSQPVATRRASYLRHIYDGRTESPVGARVGKVLSETIGQERSTNMPEIKGWWMAGSHPKEYAHGIAPGEQMENKPVALVRCAAPEPSGFGTLMQMIAPDEYRGKRVR